MSKTKRVFTLLFAALLASGSITSCNGTTTEITDTESTPIGVESEPVATDDDRLDSGLPEMDLEGYKITFYGKSVKGIHTEEMNGEIVNDGVFNRDIDLCEKYNFEIEYITPSNQISPTVDIIQTVAAGDDAYQVLIDGGNRFVGFIQSGLLFDMIGLKYQDYSKPWWFENMNNGISLRGKLYMSNSAFMLSSLEGLYQPVINADLAADLGVDVEDLYQMVREGKWTIDRLIEIIKLGGSDLNGDGVKNHEDQWGLQCEVYGGYVLAVGCGFQIAKKDANDEPYFTVASDNAIDLWDKLCNEIFTDTENYLSTQNITGVADVWTTQGEILSGGRNLVAICPIGSGWREFEFDYAVMPSPKLNEDQEFYYHTGSSWNNPMMGVPITVGESDKVSLILEAMSHASYYDVLPAFYQDYLERKIVRDEGSVEMLKIIHNSIFYDPGAIYNWGSFVDELYKIVQNGNNNLATRYAAKETSAMTEMRAMMETIGE